MFVQSDYRRHGVYFLRDRIRRRPAGARPCSRQQTTKLRPLLPQRSPHTLQSSTRWEA